MELRRNIDSVLLVSFGLLTSFGTFAAPKITISTVSKKEFEQKYQSRFIPTEITAIVLRQGTDANWQQLQNGGPKINYQYKELGEIEKLLKGRVQFISLQSGMDSSEASRVVQITPTHPINQKYQTIKFASESLDQPLQANNLGLLYFSVYYPQYQVVSFDGKDASALAYDLRTGESADEIGSPEDFVDSPSGQWRISGAYNGQECHNYFLAQRTGVLENIPRYQKVHEFNWEQTWCVFNQVFWLNDHTFYIKAEIPNDESAQAKYKYNRVSIRN